MPNISEMRESKFLKKEDVGAGALVTIADCQQYNVAKDGAPAEHKWCLTFNELDKPLVLNSTNIQMCAQICGSENTDDWMGHRIVLYTDPNVSYQGKLIGGIRVRAPKKTAPPAAPARRSAQPAPVRPPVQETTEAPVELTDDDIPF